MKTCLPVLLIFMGVLLAPKAWAGCALATQDPAALARWKQSGFAVDDADERFGKAELLIDCLGDPDPALRDGIAFEALSRWMREGVFEPETLRVMETRLQGQLEGSDAAGFRKPFAALALSELARTDRIQPWMTTAEREDMAQAAAGYLASVRDYRGYVDGEGWRHGVAHGADWAMQLGLNPALSPPQRIRLLDAIGTQVMPAGEHAYAFGEPMRLARAAVYTVARGGVAQADIDAWLSRLTAQLGPQPDGKAQAGWWIHRANLEGFLTAVIALSGAAEAPALAGLAQASRTALQRVP